MYNRAEIIQQIIDRIGAKRYLEIGVAHAETFLSLDVDERIGVDPVKPAQRTLSIMSETMAQSLNRTPKIGLSMEIDHTDMTFRVRDCERWLEKGSPKIGTSQKTNLYQLPSDQFFNYADELIGPRGIDVAFVDGLHEWQQVVRDVENCLRYLNKGGVILMHDCCPVSEIVATPFDKLEEAKKKPEWNGAWTGDVWKAAVWLRSSRKDLSLFVLNCDWGVGVLTRNDSDNDLNYEYENIKQLPFSEFEEKRDTILDLKDPTYLTEFLGYLSPLVVDDEKSEPSTV